MNKRIFDATSIEKLTKMSKSFIKKIEKDVIIDSVCQKNHSEYIDKKGKKHYTLEVWYEFR